MRSVHSWSGVPCLSQMRRPRSQRGWRPLANGTPGRANRSPSVTEPMRTDDVLWFAIVGLARWPFTLHGRHGPHDPRAAAPSQPWSTNMKLVTQVIGSLMCAALVASLAMVVLPAGLFILACIFVLTASVVDGNVQALFLSLLLVFTVVCLCASRIMPDVSDTRQCLPSARRPEPRRIVSWRRRLARRSPGRRRRLVVAGSTCRMTGPSRNRFHPEVDSPRLAENQN